MNFIKILGASGGKTQRSSPTTFQIYKDILIDAGNVINSIDNNAKFINHIFLTHAHADHILDLPFVIEGFFEQRKSPLTIYALQETIDAIKKHTFNNEIWPDFSQIPMLNQNKMSLIFRPIKINESIQIRDYTFKAISANHIPGACGYVVTKEKSSFLISGDTYVNDELIEELNSNKSITSILIECSFPNAMEQLAKESQHLTPQLLANELAQLKRDDLQIFLYHLKPSYYDTMVKQIHKLDILKNGGKILECGDVIHFSSGGEVEPSMESEDKFERMVEINLSLANELNKDKLFEMLLTLSRELTHADAGTLYIMAKDRKSLDFKVVQNHSLDIFMGGTKSEIDWENLPLYLDDGSENLGMVAAVSALQNKIINIADVYDDDTYNFEGTKKFDESTSYRSQSMLVLPLINHEDDVIGVLQLINKTKITERVTNFNRQDERVIKALSAQVAMALNNTQLIESVDGFITAFIDTICHAIEAKSTHTRNHIAKVAKISTLLAQAVHEDQGIYKEVSYSQNQLKQIEVAAWMHDIGKISMPESIIDKSKKLETIIDRIELINERFEVLLRDVYIDFLEKKIDKVQYITKKSQINTDKDFIANANKGEEFMSDEKIARVHEIAQYTYIKNGQTSNILTANEVDNLCIRRGTLTDHEKYLMNTHAQLSYDMLGKIPFPKKYKDVMHIAANHHEKPNGKGYPRGLDDSQLTLEDKIMALADIFEALTASDRPYKDGKKLSEVFKILSFMVKDGELDGDLVKFLHEHEMMMNYCKEELDHTQLDESRLLF